MMESMLDADHDLARYSRQTRFAPLGEAGQRRLASGRALICGCGALGSVIANTLARAGVGKLRIVDRDYPDLSNLQRQVLFDEADVAAGLPKAVAAAEKLRRANSTIEIEPVVADVDHTNLVELCQGVDVIVDGTDNFETRFLLNDAALNLGIPWVYGGCLGAEGQSMTILPGRTPCLRCLMPEPPEPGTSPTCDTAGILAGAIGVVASLQSVEAIKILSGRLDAVSPYLTVVDLWHNTQRQLRVATLQGQADCPACNGREYPWLAGNRGSQSAVLCGRNAVQLRSSTSGRLSLDELAARLATAGPITRNPYLLRLSVEDYTLTVFPDGRAIVVGTEDPAVARGVYARYVGA
jgi:adenylyltransferase/sulfurtransferase